jgi:serine/threonine-protein kinase PknG
VLADGYCDTCGALAAPIPAAPVPATAAPGGPSPDLDRGRGSVPSVSIAALTTGSARARGSRRTTSARTASSRRQAAIGAGLVEVPAAPALDPRKAVIANPEVAEDKRFCSSCGAPVGRSRAGQPGRVQGFCPKCRNAFDFTPKLAPGQMVGGQYQVAGAIAHGGLGWIYLAQDRAVNDRWVVLKGLLDTGDEAAMAVAVAEKRFLAEVQHPTIVQIYNFATYEDRGYIVMEYVGGPSLKNMLKQRRDAKGGQPDPLPVDVAIAFMLAALPAFSYLHARGLVYCDFKPDNLCQVADQVKLIDLGAVRRLDDPSGDVYGTVGYQAPEIATAGPSIASDVYTVGRTLAALTLDFRGYQSTFEHTLPDPADHPALDRWPSFHRLLLKATAPHPDDRFQSVAELGDQLLGVLRQVVAHTTGTPQPGPSGLFAGVPAAGELPALAIDASDPAAALLTTLPADDPAGALAALADAVEAGQVPETVEVRLRRARALADAGDTAAALALLERVEADDPWEWRAVWLRGVIALATGDLATAASAFERCRFEVPGELAPELAAAMVAEQSGDLGTAAALYDTVAGVDPAYVGADTGLARCRLATGDVAGALAAYGRVPVTHRSYADAQIDAAQALIGHGRFSDASAVLDRLDVDEVRKTRLEVNLLEAAVAAVTGGAVADGATPADPNAVVRGRRFAERPLRQGLEIAYRRLAAHTADDDERARLVDRANAARPRTLW